MRIARVEVAGEAFWALLDADSVRLRAIRASFSEWVKTVGDQGEAALDLDPEWIPLSACRLLPPLHPGGRIFGVGLNYLTHLERLGSKTPAHTLAYSIPESALVGAGDDIQFPAVTDELDYEVELVAVVARPLLDEPQASSCLLGYTVGNDISARDAGRLIGRLDLLTQKAMDRTTPIGPWIVTFDELGGPGQPALNLQLSVNGELRQRDNTGNMIFPVDELLNYLNARIALRPGDLVFTGSTHGVALETGNFLKPGDAIDARIEGVGQLCNRVGERRELHAARKVGRLGLPAGDDVIG